jgi:hypothetical protein
MNVSVQCVVSIVTRMSLRSQNIFMLKKFACGRAIAPRVNVCMSFTCKCLVIRLCNVADLFDH